MKAFAEIWCSRSPYWFSGYFVALGLSAATWFGLMFWCVIGAVWLLPVLLSETRVVPQRPAKLAGTGG